MIKLYLIKKLVSNKEIEKWISWLNDQGITEFSEKRFKKHTITSQRKFLLEKIKEKSSYIFQIKFKNKFIGVIELSSVNILNKGCEISYMIGEKKMHGQGLGTEAIKICLEFAKYQLNLKTVYAGINSKNIKSERVLKKNFFRKVNLRNEYYRFKERYIDINNSILFQKKLL
tara:strand:+ start:100 stop:615 length:516 start_codon:yes stop_codon:yes gene_type:complete